MEEINIDKKRWKREDLTTLELGHLIEQGLLTLLLEEKIQNPLLLESATYALSSGGKRLRPKIAIAIASLYGVSQEISITPALALELIHTYSLIHDDLPCMDDDDFRRGKPSLHKVFGEANALLTGDFLLTYAFELISVSPKLTDHTKIALITSLAQQSGSRGMVGGQVLDLSYTKKKSSSWEEIEKIHLKKTAALFQASFEFGAILACSKDLPLLSQIGKLFGLAFQLKDDLMDQEELLEDKPNGVALLGVEKTEEKLYSLEKEISLHVSHLSVPTAPLEKLFNEIGL